MSKALLNAVKRGDTVGVRGLLDRETDPNQSLPGFWSPLAVASYRGDPLFDYFWLVGNWRSC